MAKFKQGDRVINKNGSRKIVDRVVFNHFFTAGSIRYLVDDFELDEPDTSKAIKLLIDAGYTVTPPKPKLTGKVYIYVATKCGYKDDILVSHRLLDSNEYERMTYKLLAITDWTEGDGI